MIGSRGSALAMAQARLVHDALHRVGHSSRIVIIETEGDRRSPDTAWGEGAFVAAIEQALLDGASTSPSTAQRTFRPTRTHGFGSPPTFPGPTPATRSSSGPTPRSGASPTCHRALGSGPTARGGQASCSPGGRTSPSIRSTATSTRGSAGSMRVRPTRSCSHARDWTGMGLGDRIAERLDPEIVPPAPGQGAIAVQVRSDDERMLALAAPIDDRRTRLAVEAERAFLRASGGGCRAPIGALATIVGRRDRAPRGYANPDGPGPRRPPPRSRRRLARNSAAGSPPSSTRGRAFEPTRRRRTGGRRSSAPRVLVTRAAEQAGELLSALRDAGLDPVPVPAIAIEFEPPGGDLDAAAGLLHTYRMGGRSRARTARGRSSRPPSASGRELGAPSWAAIGPATRRVLEHEGIEVASSRARAAASRWPPSCRSSPATGSSSSAATSPTRSSRSRCGHGGPRSTT